MMPKNCGGNTRGQNLTEVAILLALVAAVFTGMQIYLQRSMQARYKAGVDFVLRDKIGLTKRQYDPYYRTSEMAEYYYKKDFEKKKNKTYETREIVKNTTGEVVISSTKDAD
jgi:hypothetical protein